MTKQFDIFIKTILGESGMGVADVLGNDGSYDTSDPRTPYIMNGIQRRNLKPRKRKKKK
jgi:hypothetical protein